MPDIEVDGVLTKAASSVWKTIRFLVYVTGVGVALLTVDHELASRAAAEVMRPIDEKLERHLTEVAATKEYMLGFVREQREVQRSIQRKLTALCQNSRAQCPLD